MLHTQNANLDFSNFRAKLLTITQLAEFQAQGAFLMLNSPKYTKNKLTTILTSIFQKTKEERTLTVQLIL